MISSNPDELCYGYQRRFAHARIPCSVPLSLARSGVRVHATVNMNKPDESSAIRLTQLAHGGG